MTDRPRGRPIVVVAEDDADIRALISYTLSGEEFEVVTTGDGEEALQLALERAPDVLILDLNLPRLSGADVLRAMPQAGSGRDVRVLVLSGAADGARIAEVDGRGADGYVRKPFSSVDLLERVRELLGPE